MNQPKLIGDIIDDLKDKPLKIDNVANIVAMHEQWKKNTRYSQPMRFGSDSMRISSKKIIEALADSIDDESIQEK